MSARARGALPLAVAVAVAAVAFAAVLLATRTDARAPAGARAPALVPTRADVRSGRLVFARMGCGSCHRLGAAGSSGQIGPPLDQELPHHTADSLRAKITAPGGGSIMPQDFARRMGAADLRALVAFLLAARDGTAAR